ncbi:Hypothetical_protein [Hexamita inflata]|uniref:Hypothetical_protein n=1 Tax=Hexamita inflata TaxID=28002 RepID=A0AA86PP10_9EUKA|nr:Hypothetical protein HINF_LOCUS30711 [Hexamita inflata]
MSSISLKAPPLKSNLSQKSYQQQQIQPNNIQKPAQNGHLTQINSKWKTKSVSFPFICAESRIRSNMQLQSQNYQSSDSLLRNSIMFFDTRGCEEFKRKENEVQFNHQSNYQLMDQYFKQLRGIFSQQILAVSLTEQKQFDLELSTLYTNTIEQILLQLNELFQFIIQRFIPKSLKIEINKYFTELNEHTNKLLKQVLEPRNLNLICTVQNYGDQMQQIQPQETEQLIAESTRYKKFLNNVKEQQIEVQSAFVTDVNEIIQFEDQVSVLIKQCSGKFDVKILYELVTTVRNFVPIRLFDEQKKYVSQQYSLQILTCINQQNIALIEECNKYLNQFPETSGKAQKYLEIEENIEETLTEALQDPNCDYFRIYAEHINRHTNDKLIFRLEKDTLKSKYNLVKQQKSQQGQRENRTDMLVTSRAKSQITQKFDTKRYLEESLPELRARLAPAPTNKPQNVPQNPAETELLAPLPQLEVVTRVDMPAHDPIKWQPPPEGPSKQELNREYREDLAHKREDLVRGNIKQIVRFQYYIQKIQRDLRYARGDDQKKLQSFVDAAKHVQLRRMKYFTTSIYRERIQWFNNEMSDKKYAKLVKKTPSLVLQLKHAYEKYMINYIDLPNTCYQYYVIMYEDLIQQKAYNLIMEYVDFIDIDDYQRGYLVNDYCRASDMVMIMLERVEAEQIKLKSPQAVLFKYLVELEKEFREIISQTTNGLQLELLIDMYDDMRARTPIRLTTKKLMKKSLEKHKKNIIVFTEKYKIPSATEERSIMARVQNAISCTQFHKFSAKYMLLYFDQAQVGLYNMLNYDERPDNEDSYVDDLIEVQTEVKQEVHESGTLFNPNQTLEEIEQEQQRQMAIQFGMLDEVLEQEEAAKKAENEKLGEYGEEDGEAELGAEDDIQ